MLLEPLFLFQVKSKASQLAVAVDVLPVGYIEPDV